jgi:hypothetical protein
MMRSRCDRVRHSGVKSRSVRLHFNISLSPFYFRSSILIAKTSPLFRILCFEIHDDAEFRFYFRDRAENNAKAPELVLDNTKYA